MDLNLSAADVKPSKKARLEIAKQVFLQRKTQLQQRKVEERMKLLPYLTSMPIGPQLIDSCEQ